MTPTFKNNSTPQPRSRMALISFFLPLFSWLLALLLTTGLWAAGQLPIKIEPLVLRATPLPFIPKEFYIASIIDEREDRKAVAYLIPPAVPNSPTATAPPAAQPVDLQGGGLKAVEQFIRQSLRRNTELRPIVIRLKEYRVTETPGATKGRVDGIVKVALAFDYQREDKLIRLVEYRGGARYSRPAGQLTIVEPTLRQSLTDGLRYINTWMDREANRNDKLAKGIQVHFTDYTANAEDDTVFYTPNRPLIWSDFTGRPRAGRYAALVFPGFAYEGGSDVVNGIIHLNLKMKVYVLRGSSWVKETARDAYSLNHEQRHFDIVKLVAERFKQKVQPDSLTLEDYNSIVQYKFIESFREMNRLQEQYDGETQHGINQAVQAHWNQRIDTELRKFGVKE